MCKKLNLDNKTRISVILAGLCICKWEKKKKNRWHVCDMRRRCALLPPGLSPAAKMIYRGPSFMRVG